MRHTGDQNAVSQTDAHADTFPSEAAGRQLEFFAETSQHAAKAKQTKVHVVRARHMTPVDIKARQGARVQRLMFSATLALIYLLVITIFYLKGLVELHVLQMNAALIAANFVFFRLCFASGLNLKAEEKNLRLPITLSAICVMLYTVYVAPVTQIAFIPFLFLILAFVMHRVTPREVLFLAGVTLVGYGVVVAVHYRARNDNDMLMLECAQFLVLALTLPAFAVLANRVQRLHSALFKANRKIRDIEEDAQRDVLLGCFNRRYIVAALEQQKRLADETGTPLCLAVIDLDNFKRINDEAGHLRGDEVLRVFTRIAQANVREGDIFGRYGGEEFLLVLPETTLLAALNVAERIREQVEHFDWDEKLRNRVTVSIGLTQHMPGESVFDLFSRTDTAMYMAKQGGRNQVVVEEPTLDLGIV